MLPQSINSKQNRATEALIWNFYMSHINGMAEETWRNYWSRFKKCFLEQKQYFRLCKLEGEDLPFDQWSYMELTTEGENGKKIEIINDIKNPANSIIKVYDKKTDELLETMNPNLEHIPS